MEPFQYHVFICDQQKPQGVPCCPTRGSGETIEALRREIAARGLADKVQVTTCGSLGLCERGPNMVVYPEGVWYSNVTAEDVPEIVSSHFQRHKVVERLVNVDAPALHTEITANRERFMAARRARDAAGMLPEDLNQTIRAYQESRAILTALEMDLFSAVGQGATAAEAASTVRANPRATEMLLNALVALGLLAKQENTFHNTPLTLRFFVAGSKDCARPSLMHTAHLWHTWSTLTEAVRAGTSVAYREIPERGEDWTEAFIAAMHRNAAERAPLVVRAVGTEGVRRMLDVGGGSGAYSIAFAQASKTLTSEILDLGTVLRIARRHIREAGLTDRIKTREGDLRRDDFGKSYDLVFLSAICHMLGLEENRDLLKRCFRALGPQGRVVIQDFVLEADKTAPKFAALFALNMLVGTEGGSSYSEEEYTAWLKEAGFADVRRLRLPGPTDLMMGTRK
jgi:(2Fe-2S) ferredoxin/ubiquinone/menaquinone biosynthesis C-methylase UbiE